MARRNPPPLPAGMPATPSADIANQLHTIAIHLLRRAGRHDRRLGLTPERLSLLSVLVYGGPQTVTSLAAIEGITPTAVSRSLNTLEDLGLAVRMRDRGDRRVATVSATPAGEELMQRGRELRLRELMALVQGLSDKELRAVERACGPLLDMLGEA